MAVAVGNGHRNPILILIDRDHARAREQAIGRRIAQQFLEHVLGLASPAIVDGNRPPASTLTVVSTFPCPE